MRHEVLMHFIQDSVSDGKNEGRKHRILPQPQPLFLMEEGPLTQQTKEEINARMGDFIGTDGKLDYGGARNCRYPVDQKQPQQQWQLVFGKMEPLQARSRID